MGLSTWFSKRAESPDNANTAARLQGTMGSGQNVTLAYQGGRPTRLADIAGGQNNVVNIKTLPHGKSAFAMTPPSPDSNRQPSHPHYVGKGKTRFWSRIPQLVNHFWYLVTHKPAHHDDYLDYDPFYLRIFTNQRYNAFGDQFYVETLKEDRQLIQRLGQKEMDLETFKLVLEQIPGVRTIEFSGRGEPLLNPDLFGMLHYARQHHHVETIVVSNGHLLTKYTPDILKSPLSQICITLHGHKPSTYHQMSGLDAHNFVPIVENIKHLIARRNSMRSSLKIVLSMTVDVHTFRSMPEMIVFAHELGADGIVFNNYLSQNPEESSERTLYDDQSIISDFFTAIEQKLSNFPNLEVTLPVLIERNMSRNRHCREAYTTVAVDASCTVYPCSRQLLLDELGDTPKIWEPDFWNHTSYHHLRNIHSQSAAAQGLEVPLACQNCPRNLSNAL